MARKREPKVRLEISKKYELPLKIVAEDLDISMNKIVELVLRRYLGEFGEFMQMEFDRPSKSFEAPQAPLETAQAPLEPTRASLDSSRELPPFDFGEIQ